MTSNLEMSKMGAKEKNSYDNFSIFDLKKKMGTTGPK
jgi:hypothetical protein